MGGPGAMTLPKHISVIGNDGLTYAESFHEDKKCETCGQKGAYCLDIDNNGKYLGVGLCLRDIVVQYKKYKVVTKEEAKKIEDERV
jgi:hypothetical protein